MPDDEQAVVDCLRQEWISGSSPIVEELERSLAASTGTEFAIATSSGTAACDILNEISGVGPGDQVVVPATTIISTISHAARRGAEIVCVDVDANTWCANPSNILSELNAKTKLVWLVHLFGMSTDVAPIVEVCDEESISVFEDAAEAIGLRYRNRPVGRSTKAGIFSFYANKTVTGGEGGAIVTSQDSIANSARGLRNLNFDAKERFVHFDLGFNFRMPALPAALANSQLSRLQRHIERKKEIGLRYQNGLASHPWLQLPIESTDYCENTYWVFAIVLSEDAPLGAQQLRERLVDESIETRRFFYPLHLQPALLARGSVSARSLPNAERLWERGLYLPSGVGTTNEEIDKTIEAVWKVCR